MKGAVGDWSHTLCPLHSQVFDILDCVPHGIAHADSFALHVRHRGTFQRLQAAASPLCLSSSGVSPVNNNMGCGVLFFVNWYF